MTLKEMKTPDLGGAAEVTVIEILVKPGDQVEADTPVITLESDKATMEVPVEESATIKEVLVKVGDQIAEGAPLLSLEVNDNQGGNGSDSEKEEAKSQEKQASSEDTKPQAEPKDETPIESKSVSGALETSSDADVHAGPGVRRFAHELGVNLAEVKGTGPKDRVIKEDVQAFVKGRMSGGAAMPATTAFDLPVIDFSQFGEIEEKTLSRIKKLSGKFLQRNWAMIPHVTQFVDADITSLEEFRKSQKDALAKQEIKLTPLAFVMKAVVASLKAFPDFNASLSPSGETLIMKNYFHIGVAVDTPEGLVVPVIRDVDQKGLTDLAKELAEVSEKARNKQLTPRDMQGGCFSISSLGGIGGTAFTPIINYPEVAILGVSKASYQPVYQDGEFEPRLMLPLSLSYDHRVIDGAEGARFVMHLSNMLSDIRNLLM